MQKMVFELSGVSIEVSGVLILGLTLSVIFLLVLTITLLFSAGKTGPQIQNKMEEKGDTVQHPVINKD
jgi:hypothetical protein